GATFRCRDCLYSPVVCKTCMLDMHRLLPLHVISVSNSLRAVGTWPNRAQEWNSEYFDHATLYALGLCIQLGHGGEECESSTLLEQPMVVVDISGIHKVSVRICKCRDRDLDDTLVPSQLMDVGWWPATFTRPQTVVTETACKFFQTMTQQSKLNMHDFWNGLVRLTDGAGLRHTPTGRVVKMFSNIRQAKRSGRGHENSGIAGTSPGELAVPCIACPRPKVNIDVNWRETTPPEKHFVNNVMVSVDANFKLTHKCKMTKEVALSDGFAYFVDTGIFHAHLKKYGKDDKEMKYCSSSHNAVHGANAPGDSRFDVNGIGACVCARHNFYRPQSIVDLYLGERLMSCHSYVFMDHAVLSSLECSGEFDGCLVFYFIYDIACQWSVNFHRRLKKYERGAYLRGKEGVEVRFAIPKMHIKAHGPKCNEKFPLNYLPGVGRAYGEGIEGNWANTNGAVLSTREMSKSARHETLDDLFSSINWRRIVGMGTSLLSGLTKATYEHVKQNTLFDKFSTTFPAQVVSKWTTLYNRWIANDRAPNPFHQEDDGMAWAKARLELADEEAKDIEKGRTFKHKMTPSVWLTEGMDLEDQRFVLRRLAKRLSSSPSGRVELAKKRNTYRLRVIKFREAQRLYMKEFHLAQLKAKEARDIAASQAEAAASAEPSSTSASTSPPTPVLPPLPIIERLDLGAPEKTELWLPSSLPAEFMSLCPKRLRDTELKLQRAQVEAQLHNTRRQIQLKAGLLRDKNVHVDGAGIRANQRARTVINRIQDKIDRSVARYNVSRCAALALDPSDDAWATQFKELRPQDCKPLTKDEDRDGVGFKALTWIWLTRRADRRDVLIANAKEMTDEDVHEGMRVEWAEGRARVLHWDEEREIRLAEMARSLKSLLYEANQWDNRKGKRTQDVTPSIRRGLDAYAARQAAMYEGIARSFYDLWRPTVEDLKLTVDW
ncbi:hypothetical protein PENSPDRAFT_549932, partial [Peniophora sp. CONT]